MKLKATELRLGNLIWNEVQNISVKVDIRILADINDYDKEWHPIPLTEEWLIKFGFEIRGEDYYKYSYYEVGKITGKWYFDDGNFIIKDDINYVHQLQNLYFALTYEELTIK